VDYVKLLLVVVKIDQARKFMKIQWEVFHWKMNTAQTNKAVSEDNYRCLQKKSAPRKTERVQISAFSVLALQEY